MRGRAYIQLLMRRMKVSVGIGVNRQETGWPILYVKHSKKGDRVVMTKHGFIILSTRIAK